MEEKIEIARARISFKSYLMLSFVMGVLFSIIMLAIELLIGLINGLAGNPDVTLSDQLLNFIMLITGPLMSLAMAAISYPAYRWLVNKKFTMKLVVYQLK